MQNSKLASIQIRPALKRPAFLEKVGVIDIERENALIAALGSSVKIPILPSDSRFNTASEMRAEKNTSDTNFMLPQTLADKPSAAADMTMTLEQRLLGSSIMAMNLDDSVVNNNNEASAA